MGRPKKPQVKRHERKHGEGSLARVGPSTWRAFLPRRPDGTRPSKRFDSEAAALAWLRAGGETGPGGRVTAETPFGDYLVSWLADKELAPQSRPRYERAVALAEPLWPIPLRELTRRDFDGLWAEWRRRGLGPTTIAGYRGYLSAALNAAADLIPTNPIRSSKLPKRGRRAPAVWSEPDIRRFLAEADRSRFPAYWRLLLGIGCRPSEARALQWWDLDERAGTLKIRRSLTARGRLVGPTKTTREREVDLPGPVLAALLRHRAGQQPPSEWVFARPDGRPWSPDTFAKEYARILKAAKLPPLKLYNSRHSAASLMLAKGIPAADVAAILGHSTPVTTMRFYHGSMAHHRKRAAELMGELMGGEAAREAAEE